MSLHVEMTNPQLVRVYRDDQSGELVLEFRHHSDTLSLVWYVNKRAAPVVTKWLQQIADIGSGILNSENRSPEWEAPRTRVIRRHPRALDRAGLTEPGPPGPPAGPVRVR